MSLSFLSKGQSWTALEPGQASLFLSAYSISSHVQPQGYSRACVGLRKNGTVRFSNLKLQSQRLNWGTGRRGLLRTQYAGTHLVWFIEEVSKRSSPESHVSCSQGLNILGHQPNLVTLGANTGKPHWDRHMLPIQTTSAIPVEPFLQCPVLFTCYLI